QALVTGVIDAEVFRALLKQGLHPGLNVGGLKVSGFAEQDIPAGGIRAEPFPQTCEIGFAIRSARGRRGEVRFATRSARDAGRPIVYPLGLERRHQDRQNNPGLEYRPPPTLPYPLPITFILPCV